MAAALEVRNAGGRGRWRSEGRSREITRLAVWVVSFFVAPALLLGGFMVWLDVQPNGLSVGRGRLWGSYEVMPRGQAANYTYAVFPPGPEGERVYVYIAGVGDRQYCIAWRD